MSLSFINKKLFIVHSKNPKLNTWKNPQKLLFAVLQVETNSRNILELELYSGSFPIYVGGQELHQKYYNKREKKLLRERINLLVWKVARESSRYVGKL